MGKKRVADLVTKVLAEAGVRRIYGVPGDSLNGITDSIRQRKDIAVDPCATRGDGSFRRWAPKPI
jgi:thiamine pyrophosphate-dependent acetolactate synthase large subunit-like protein